MSITKNTSAEIATLLISQTQFNSFEEIVKVAHLNRGYYPRLEANEKAKNFIFSPISSDKEEEIVLYWEGQDQKIPGDVNIYKYFSEKGYEVIPNIHTSYLFNAMKELTEEKLKQLGVLNFVNIVLLTEESSLISEEYGVNYFLGIYRDGGNRKLVQLRFDGSNWNGAYLFLLKKRT